MPTRSWLRVLALARSYAMGRDRVIYLIEHLRSLAMAEKVSKRDGATPIYTRSADVITELQDRLDTLEPLVAWVRYMVPTVCNHVPTPSCPVCMKGFSQIERILREHAQRTQVE